MKRAARGSRHDRATIARVRWLGRILFVTSTAATLAESTAAEQPPRRAMPGPWPTGHTGDVAQQNAACASCHEDIAAEWRRSLHRQSFTNAPFAAAFAREPLAFCQGCHAPEVVPSRAPPAWASDVGVGCVTCHVVGGSILAGARTTAARAAPHAVTRDPWFATERACAACHEFDFPGAGAHARTEKMQSTVTEHAASSAPERPCAECHMARAAGAAGDAHRSHDFAASRDPAWLRGAIAVRAERESARVRLVLSPRNVGHAFPTGDLFRRLEIRAWAEGAAPSIRYLARHIEISAGTLARTVTRDDRLGTHGDQPQTIELELGPAAARRAIRWRVTYQRVAHPGRARDESDAALDGEVVLAEGTLAPPD